MTAKIWEPEDWNKHLADAAIKRGEEPNIPMVPQLGGSHRISTTRIKKIDPAQTRRRQGTTVSRPGVRQDEAIDAADGAEEVVPLPPTFQLDRCEPV